MPVDSAISITALTKRFGPKRLALDNVSLEVMPGELVALIGPSGSGKSTLLRHIAGLTPADRGAGGSITVRGRVMQRDGKIAPGVRSMRAEIGFVFQQFNLVSRLTLLTNVVTGALGRTPLWRNLLGWFPANERAKAMEALERVGIADYAEQRASTLSGGQQQRAAIARAMVQGAKILLADEPIASLDPESSRKVMDTLQNINREDGITVLVTLHQVDIAIQYCPRVLALRDGKIVYDGPSAALTRADLANIYGEEASSLGHHLAGVREVAAPGFDTALALAPE